jgi:hypothetical protein
MRWPSGVRCAVCGGNRISRIERTNIVKKGEKAGQASKNVRKNVYQCLEPTCKQQFSVTAGTIFHDTRIPLTKWFLAISLVMEAKKGMSAMQLKRSLWGDHKGSYQTAWHMMHRIREAMAEETGPFNQLRGVVEIDETYIGGKAKRRGGRVRNQKPRAEKFDMVLGMRERGGRVKYVHIADGKAATIREAVQKHVVPSPTRIYTDAAAVYDFAFDPELKKKHRSVNHSIQWVVPGTRIHTNTVESSFSLLKRGLIGSFHRVSIKHLHRYLSEFEHRFNHRKSDNRFEEMVSRTGRTSPLPYQKLIAE